MVPLGRRGGRGRGRGDGSNRGQRLCRNYAETGHCQYGDRCHFSHGAPSSEKGERTSSLAKTEYNDWKRIIKRDPIANDIATMENLWTGALKILDGDDWNLKQMLPYDLDNGEYRGREHMHTILNMVARTHGHGIFIKLCRPFLMVFTHPAFLDCLSVDTYVGGLYNFLCGSNGSRAIPFFTRLATALVAHCTESEAFNLTTVVETLVSLATALREMLRREQRALFYDGLTDLVDIAKNVLEVVKTPQSSGSIQQIHDMLGEIRGMEARAKGLLVQEEESHDSGVTTTVITSTYPRQLNEPQDRHDNDKKDITKISILPTEQEIRSDCPPFLPSTDLDQPHFLSDPLERHLDTHFRLLRHDVFGELREALAGAMCSIEDNPALLEDSRFNLGSIRAWTNPEARVSYVAFDQKRGLETQITFLQPLPLRSKSALEKQRWWEESKRMEEGSLLCLLYLEDGICSLLFFIVSRKATDAKHDHGLSSDKSHATVTAKLTSTNQHDVERMVTLSSQNKQGLLIDLPGVVLATFVPILENIQNMQRLSRLPFRRWILPDRVDKMSAHNSQIPAPLYARDSDFTFILDPILNESSQSMIMDADTEVDDDAVVDDLNKNTKLDRGQSRALIAALTREFSFVQGPPGTGKSFLGVQLMRVLLASKARAELGPIIIV